MLALALALAGQVAANSSKEGQWSVVSGQWSVVSGQRRGLACGLGDGWKLINGDELAAQLDVESCALRLAPRASLSPTAPFPVHIIVADVVPCCLLRVLPTVVALRF